MNRRPVSAVVVRWRGGDEVNRCLESLMEHARWELENVILVDSGSGDGGADRLASTFPSVHVVALDHNRSFAWAVAQGADTCPDHHLLILNPDTQITPGAVARLVGHLEDHPEIAGTVPLLIEPGGASQHLWQLRRLPTAARLAGGCPGAPQFPDGPPDRPAAVAQPAASAWLVRRAVWDTLGGFDPVFAPAWWEDVDFCARLEAELGDSEFPASTGFFVVPDAIVKHQGASSLSDLHADQFLAVYYRNLMRYVDRHHERHRTSIRIGLELSLMGRALLRPSRRRGYLQALRGLSL
jgi:GT2 family glycosyltransferase